MPRKECSQGAQQESYGTEQRASRNRLGCGVGRLLCLFLGLVDGLLVLLLVLLDLGLGLIDRNVLSLRERIGGLVRGGGLLGGITCKRRANGGDGRISDSRGVLPSRGAANLVFDRSHRVGHAV